VYVGNIICISDAYLRLTYNSKVFLVDICSQQLCNRTTGSLIDADTGMDDQPPQNARFRVLSCLHVSS
jgi:hypothetical protein